MSLSLRQMAGASMAALMLVTSAAGTANAVPWHRAGANYVTTTEDGLTLNVTRSKDSFEVMLPDNLSPLSHQTFLDTKGVATIKGATGKKIDAHLMVGYQIGCMIDASDGATFMFRAPTLSTGMELTQALNGMPSLSGQGKADGGGGTISGIGATSTLRPHANLEVPLGPDVIFTLRPGQILTFLVAEKDIRGDKGALRYVGEPINIDGCLGFASVRSFITLWTRAPIENSKITLWGKVTRF